jgi:Dolichyl-phosphate-mannose-protein mannosyltransferase
MPKRSRHARRGRDEAPRARAAGVARAPAGRQPVGLPPETRDGPFLWREHGVAIVVLFVLALSVRVSLLVELGRTPFFQVRNIDSEAYHLWAVRIAAGHWMPTEAFYQSPVYAYFLAVLYKLFGDGSWSPRVVQVVLGSLSAVLVYAIGARLFSRRVGWLAGLGLALYGPIVLEEITFSKTTVLVAGALAAFALYLSEIPRGRTAGALASGVLFGVTVAGVGQWMLAFLALIAWAPMMAERLAPARRRRITAAFAAGGLMVLLPLVAWNTGRGGGLMLTSGDAGLNFYNGNNERASGLPAKPVGLRDVPQYEEGDARWLAERAVGHRLSPAEVSRFWTQRALAWISGHPADWLVVLGRKLLTLWNGFEIPDNYHYAFMRAHFLPLLRLLPTFALVAPLALVGLAMPFWRRRDVTALYIACGAYLATVLLFYVRGRYRIPAVPFLLVLAAMAIERLIRAVSTRRWRSAAALAAGLVVATIVTNHERCEAAHGDIAAVCLGGDSWFDSEWLKLSQWYMDKGGLDEAVRYAERAYECTRPRRAGMVPAWVAGVEARWVQDLLRDGQRDAAMLHLARAEANYRAAIGAGFEPGALRSELATLYTLAGKPAEAVRAFEAAEAVDYLDAAVAVQVAPAYVALGRCPDLARVTTKVEGALGVEGPARELRSILGTCAARPQGSR